MAMAFLARGRGIVSSSSICVGLDDMELDELASKARSAYAEFSEIADHNADGGSGTLEA